MHNKVVYSIAHALLAAGMAVLRFNFRGVGTSAGSYSGGPGEQDDIRAALDWLAARHPRVLLAGFSFGAWHGHVVAEGDPRVVRSIAVGLPVAAYGAFPCTGGGRPALFVSGEHDVFSPPERLRAVVDAWDGPAEGVVVRGAEHFFDEGSAFSPTGVRGPHRRDVLEATLHEWVTREPRRSFVDVG